MTTAAARAVAGPSPSRHGARREPWIHSATLDSLFVLSPPFLASLAVLVFSSFFRARTEVSLAAWLALVVGVDVAHVYASLYRTYLDPRELRRRPVLYAAAPLAAWAMGAVLHSFGSRVFWVALAYLAVFHFVRQQYGLVAIYSRGERLSRGARAIDRAAIYAATLYPLLYWHAHSRSFSWFTEGEFLHVPPALERAGLALYLIALAAFTARSLVGYRALNVPKTLVVAGTALSWYVGIVHFDGDLAFTLTNVLSHGIPYFALVWVTCRRQSRGESGLRARWFAPAAVPAFLGLLVLLAYVEEGVWDALVWREHGAAFPWLPSLPGLHDKAILALVVPLLALPQATHYILDGFIWKRRHLEGAL